MLRTCIGICSILLLAACEKVIDLPLENEEPKIVIEGVVDDSNYEQWVKVSQTTPFDSDSGPVFVSGASVRVIAPGGRVVSYEESRPGYYMAQNFRGVSGQSYRLEVSYNGAQYAASSTMPSKVSVDSIGFSQSTILDRSFRTINVLLQDPEDEENYYRFVLSSNRDDVQQAFIYNDKYNNGKKVIYNLNSVDMKLQAQDSIFLDVMTLDAPVYAYWKGIDGQNPGAANPANPPSNFSNGALGYFSAHTLKTIRVEVE